MKKPVDFDWYCKTKKDVINNAAYELIVALTAKSAPPRKFELSIPQRDDEMIANVVEGAIKLRSAITAIHSIRKQTCSRATSAIVVIIHTVSSRMPPGGLRCSLPNGKKILRKGVMTMADEKRYFSVKDMFEQAVTRAKTDPRYEEYSKICELDYDLLCSTCKYDKLYRCEFDVVGEVTYGSSEGIYGDIFLYGNWSKERDDPFKSRARVYVLKTLKQDKESYLAVGMLVNLICYYANEFVATHLDRFD